MKMLKYVAAIILFYGCNTGQDNVSPSSSSSDNTRVVYHTDTIYLTRNAEITPANSYSDLFLDTASVTQFIQSKNLSADDQKSFESFYNYRNLQFAWFTSGGLTEQAKGFWNLQDKFGSKADKSLQNKMDTLLNMDTLVVSRYDTTILNTELALTRAYIQFYKINKGKTQFANTSFEKAIPVKKENTMVLADSLLMQHPDSSASSLSSPYFLLMQKLQFYNTALKSGAWNTININSKQLKKGASSPAVSLLKKRLELTGDMTGSDTSRVFNDSLVTAIKNYQLHNGMKPTGILSDTVLKSLNIPLEKRIQQIIINIKRMQWMPVMQDANYIAVNIPDFMLNVFENRSKSFDMPVAVGKEGTNTTMFTGDLNQIVFSPYWNIPASIVQREILPKIKSDPNYLKSRHMEIVGKNDSLPIIRQLPGPDNSLGKAKFLFPNRYDIYFHDTNAKDIFSKDKRAVSHGCIRLADAEKMANYLLRNNNTWSPEKIHDAMNNGKEQFVKLSPVMPVIITYYTAWVDDAGQLNFRDDVYGNDKKIGQMMFEDVAISVMPPAKKDSVKNK
ncbi:MAG: L,D-transpeptidase family protein [Chitinophagaceae bacterium]|nr:L,D-transpeptidase family protein [Chitinophagaceae bacterium]